jgi:hypothetical protein
MRPDLSFGGTRARLWRWLALPLFAMLCAGAWADPPGRVGRLGEMRGTVWFYDADQREWTAAEHNRPVTGGDRIATDHGAHAEIRIGSTTVRLAGDTQVVFTELDDEHLRLQLDEGALAARLRQRESADQFEVSTPEGRFQPLAPGHYRVDRSEDNTSAMAWRGEMRFDASDSTLTIGSGQRGQFWREGGVTHYTWTAPPDDGFSDWALAADRRDERYYAENHYVSPEMTGWEDLDRDGRWENHPEYGRVWIPVNVVSGWAPYRYGHWAWVRPWGWTWVDDAAWGFAPFHYGRWFWWGNRWCWSPGAYVARPVYAPALVAWVGGPSVSVSVTVGSAPLVGWVPLAPREVYYPTYPVGQLHWRAINPYAPQRTYTPAQPVQGPIMYTNRGVPGGVTVVPADALKQRQPIANVVRTVDEKTVRQFVAKPVVLHQAPPPPAAIRTAPNAGVVTAPRSVPPPTAAVPASPQSPAVVHGVPPANAGHPEAAPSAHTPAPEAAPEAQRRIPPPPHRERAHGEGVPPGAAVEPQSGVRVIQTPVPPPPRSMGRGQEERREPPRHPPSTEGNRAVQAPPAPRAEPREQPQQRAPRENREREDREREAPRPAPPGNPRQTAPY